MPVQKVFVCEIDSDTKLTASLLESGKMIISTEDIISDDHINIDVIMNRETLRELIQELHIIFDKMPINNG